MCLCGNASSNPWLGSPSYGICVDTGFEQASHDEPTVSAKHPPL